MAHAGGRPLLFKTNEELQSAIDGYFLECKSNLTKTVAKNGDIVDLPNPLIPTIAGLAYNLGVDRHTIYNYSNKEEYFHTIKKARDFILCSLENKLANSDGNVTGAIFLSKNYGYSDKQEIEHSGSMEIKVNNDPFENVEEADADTDD